MIALAYQIFFPTWIIVTILCGACLVVGVLTIYMTKDKRRRAMRRRSRVLRVAKWGGVVVCGLLIAIYVANLWYTVMWTLPDGSGLRTGTGLIGASCRYYAGLRAGLWVQGTLPEWHSWPPLIIQRDTGGLMIWAPIWLPLLTIGIPTIILWYLDRPRPLHCHCKCGYDLTGNESGTCPECGRSSSTSAKQV